MVDCFFLSIPMLFILRNAKYCAILYIDFIMGGRYEMRLNIVKSAHSTSYSVIKSAYKPVLPEFFSLKPFS